MRRHDAGRDAVPAGCFASRLPGGPGSPPPRHYDRARGARYNGRSLFSRRRTVTGCAEERPEARTRGRQIAAVERRKARFVLRMRRPALRHPLA